MDPFIGQIVAFAGSFAPQGWALCQGQLISVSQNQALFAIIGVTYGGNGTQTFGLPDLRGRMIVGPGQGPGLSNYVAGQMGGAEKVTLAANQMPMHNHLMTAQATGGSVASPSGAFLGQVVQSRAVLDGYVPANTSSPTPVTLAPATIGNAGGTAATPTLPPTTCINYIIALQGVFPVRG